MWLPLSVVKGLRSGFVTHHLVGVAEVAVMLGVSRQRVDELARTSTGFPVPDAVLSAGRIWKREDVEARARQTGRVT